MHEATQTRPRQDPANGNKRSNSGAKRLGAGAAAEQAKAQLLELTGHPAESVSSLSRTREGWRIALEVVELERIPRTTDILASYVVLLDDDGELMAYERMARYFRNEVRADR